jgi:hypothetical protein
LTLGLANSNITIIYLKPYKQIPTEYSLSSELRDKLIQTGVIKLMGYKPTIKEWLLSCIEQIQSQKLIQTIIQYIDNLNDFPYEENKQGYL